ncbi:MAG: NPCBM/NEW2 domain-containing protein, partial [Verrucomicrobiota bacterium]
VSLAKEVRSEIEAITAETIITSANEAVQQAGEAKTAPAVPSFDSEWISLIGLDFEAEGGKYFSNALVNENEKIRTFRGVGYKNSQILYSHSPGKYTFHFHQPVTGFKGIACIESRSNKGNVVFTIETDTEGEVYRSEAVHSGRRGEEITTGFKPAKTLVLSVLRNGGGAEDWAFWLKPSISFTFQEPVAKQPKPEPKAQKPKPTEKGE